MFVVHAHESGLFINHRDLEQGYTMVYRALLEATGGRVIVVIGGDDNYKSDSEENESFISHWAKRRIALPQFRQELIDGRKSFVFSWNKSHKAIHVEALVHYFDPNAQGRKFEHQSLKRSIQSKPQAPSSANVTDLDPDQTLASSVASLEIGVISNSSGGVTGRDPRTLKGEKIHGIDLATSRCTLPPESVGDLQKYSDGTFSTLQLSAGTFVKSTLDHTQSKSSELNRCHGKIAPNTPQPVLATQISVNPPPVVLLRGVARYGKISDKLGDLQVWDPEYKIPGDKQEKLLQMCRNSPATGVRIIRYSDGTTEYHHTRNIKPFSLDSEKTLAADEKLVLKTRVREGKVSFEDADVQFKFANLYIPQYIIDSFTEKDNGKLVYIISDREDKFRCVVKREGVGETAKQFGEKELFLTFPRFF